VRNARYVRQLPLLLGLLACALDDRVLRPTDTGAAGESAARGGSPDGNAGERAEAGTAGADEDPRGGSGHGMSGKGGSSNGQGGRAPLVEGCADLDTDGVADCTITLVSTPSFESDVSGWFPIGDAELSWDPKNALNDEPSGSAKLSGRPPLVQATQCVPIDAEKLLIVYASAFVETKENADDAQAVLEISYFASDDCTGVFEGFFETPPSSETNAWTTIHAGSLSPPTTRSVSVTLVGGKARDATTQSVYFDNVMLKAQDP